ncbi:MAG: hypothetical protein M3417_03160, partial [Actinomycetota bacterium]|nr:hypothetical protein [Actinomycetota bacterium]
LSAQDDPKLAALIEVLESSPAAKVAVFTTFAATVRYLDRHLPERAGGRERLAIVGGETSPDQRTALLGRFAPDTVVRPGYQPPQGEVDMIVSTDVLSEGQNLQQAQAVVSYDMPWNPQRVVQRNGRVIRLMSPHDEVLLTTMLPEPGDLERLLGLEARIRTKVRAAGVYGMESQASRAPKRQSCAPTPTVWPPAMRACLTRPRRSRAPSWARRCAASWSARSARAKWHGCSACPGASAPPSARRPAGNRPARPACSSPCAPPRAPAVSRAAGIGATSRRPPVTCSTTTSRSCAASTPPVRTLWTAPWAWTWRAPGSAPPDDIVAAHNARVDVRAEQEAIGPRQRWALEVLRDPGVAYAPGAEEAEEALSVGRSSTVRKALGDVHARVEAGELTLDQAATQIVAVVQELGLRSVEPPVPSAPVTADDLGVVCWMAVLPAAAAV